jgi:hypothetical protein
VTAGGERSGVVRCRTVEPSCWSATALTRDETTLTVQARNRTMLAWLLFAATFGCLAAGLVVALALVRPLTVGVLATGALAVPWPPSSTPPSGSRCGRRRSPWA